MPRQSRKENILLVDPENNPVGVMSKSEAHLKGLLHRAISVLVFNGNGDFLLQKRADKKYHSAGLWTNTCCSHPHPGESTLEAANRRLMEEMGIACQLREMFSFVYHALLSNGMIEHELDIVFFGEYDSDPDINTREASEYRWVTAEELYQDISSNPGNYTAWFRLILQKLETGNFPIQGQMPKSSTEFEKNF